MRPLLACLFVASLPALAGNVPEAREPEGRASAASPAALLPIPSVLPIPSALERLIGRFALFSAEADRGLAVPIESRSRLFHLVGDSDALVTLGDLARGEGYRLKAAVELNDVVLRATAPDERVKSTDTRQRQPGDYRALDASGRPYQLRLGARLVW